MFVVVIPGSNIIARPPSTCEEVSILLTTIISSFEILTLIFVQFRLILLDRFTARGIVLRTSFRQSFLIPTHISVQRGNVTTVNQVSKYTGCNPVTHRKATAKLKAALHYVIANREKLEGQNSTRITKEKEEQRNKQQQNKEGKKKRRGENQ